MDDRLNIQPKTTQTNLRLASQMPQETVSTSVSINDINNTDIGRMLNSEGEEKRNMSINRWLNNILNRHNVRLSMAKWDVTSWDKNTDKLEDARSALADYARLAYIEEAKKDKSVDLSVLDKMKDQDIIDWMTKWDDNASQVYIDFINNWWLVSDVYKKMMRIDEDAQREEERKQSWWLKNVVGSATFEIPKQIGWLMDITWISDYLNKKELEKLDVYNQVTTDEYNKFKNGEISPEELNQKWLLWVYNDYEQDVNDWRFFWSIEDYWKTMYEQKADRYNKSMQEQMFNDFLLQYDEEWKWAWLGKFWTQLVEFAMLPWSQWNFIKNVLLWTAEILWLNAVSEWKLPTLWEWLTTASVTSLIEWILRIPWWFKVLRNLLWKVSPEMKEWLWNTTRQQYKEFEWVAKQWLSATKKKATEILDKAATWIKNKLSQAWEKLWELRQNMEWNFTYKDFFYELNSAFNKFVKEWWGKWKTPQIKIKPDWTLLIRNEEALSNVTDTEWIKLLDYIKSEWNAFMKQGREWNIQDVERFMEDLNDKIWDAITNKKIKRSDSWVGALLDWIKWAYEKLYSRMWPVAWPAFKKAKEDFSKLDTIWKFFEKYIWKLKEGKKWIDELNKLEKDMSLWEKWLSKWQDYIWEFLKILKDNNIVEEDLGSQLMSLIFTFGIKNPKQLQELIETIYPSIPWAREVVLSFIRRWLKSSAWETMLKDAVPWKLDIWEWIFNAVRPATQVWEERLLEY